MLMPIFLSRDLHDAALLSHLLLPISLDNGGTQILSHARFFTNISSRTHPLPSSVPPSSLFILQTHIFSPILLAQKLTTKRRVQKSNSTPPQHRWLTPQNVPHSAPQMISFLSCRFDLLQQIFLSLHPALSPPKSRPYLQHLPPNIIPCIVKTAGALNK